MAVYTGVFVFHAYKRIVGAISKHKCYAVYLYLYTYYAYAPAYRTSAEYPPPRSGPSVQPSRKRSGNDVTAGQYMSTLFNTVQTL